MRNYWAAHLPSKMPPLRGPLRCRLPLLPTPPNPLGPKNEVCKGSDLRNKQNSSFIGLHSSKVLKEPPNGPAITKHTWEQPREPTTQPANPNPTCEQLLLLSTN